MKISINNIDRSILTMEDDELTALYKKLENTDRTVFQEKLFASCSNERRERIERETREELSSMSSDDIIDFLKAIKNTKTFVGQSQHAEGLEILLERHPGEAKRAELFLERNQLITFETSFFALVTDIEFKKRG